MTTTPVYGIPHLQNHSANPEIVVNAMFDTFERAMNAVRTWVITGNATATQAQLAEAHMHLLTGSPGAGFDFNLPVGLPRRFAASNQTGQVATIQVLGGAGVQAALADSASAEFLSDGTDIFIIAGPAIEPPVLSYDFGLIHLDVPPVSGEILNKVVIPRAITLPANFAGAAGHVDVNPTASFAIDVTKDYASIGTITIGTGGAFTFVTAGNVAQPLAAGSVIRFIAPGSTDATIAGIAATLMGTID